MVLNMFSKSAHRRIVGAVVLFVLSIGLLAAASSIGREGSTDLLGILVTANAAEHESAEVSPHGDDQVGTSVALPTSAVQNHIMFVVMSGFFVVLFIAATKLRNRALKRKQYYT